MGFSGLAEVPSQDHLREVHDVIAGASIDHFVSEDESSKIRNFAFRSFWRKDQLTSCVVGFPKVAFYCGCLLLSMKRAFC